MFKTSDRFFLVALILVKGATLFLFKEPYSKWESFLDFYNFVVVFKNSLVGNK